MPRTALALLLPLIGSLALAQESTFEGLRAWRLRNGTLDFLVYEHGAGIPKLRMQKEAETWNAVWDPAAMARAAGRTPNPNPGVGHFLCLDGFGSASTEEQAAGLPFHGEAHLARFRRVPATEIRGSGGQILHLRAELPLLHERIDRQFQTVEGENVIYVQTRVTNLLAFDRPLFWAEHGTIGAPFLEPGVTFTDWPAVQSITRRYDKQLAGLPRRLKSGQEFTWPMAPTLNGSLVDLRGTPDPPHSTDHSTSLFSREAEWAFATAINVKLRKIIGWVFHPKEFPWLQNWEYYARPGELARGLEFSTLPFDLPRRQILEAGPLFGAPVFRILPALGTVEANFMMFYADAPEGMQGVDEVRVGDGKLTLVDKRSGKNLVLAASLTK